MQIKLVLRHDNEPAVGTECSVAILGLHLTFVGLFSSLFCKYSENFEKLCHKGRQNKGSDILLKLR